jgi:hypothetical protein
MLNEEGGSSDFVNSVHLVTQKMTILN